MKTLEEIWLVAGRKKGDKGQKARPKNGLGTYHIFRFLSCLLNQWECRHLHIFLDMALCSVTNYILIKQNPDRMTTLQSGLKVQGHYTSSELQSE